MQAISTPMATSYIHDRMKDMIVSGGENIYPAEVQNVIIRHPAVAEAAVIGVPDDRWGEAVKAFVVLKPNAQVTTDEIISFCRARIAAYKTPRSIDIVPAVAAQCVRKNSAPRIARAVLGRAASAV